MAVRSRVRQASKNAVTTASGAWVAVCVICSPPPLRDRDLVQPLDRKPPVELVLVPVGGQPGDDVPVGGQQPGLLDVEVLLLVDRAEEVGGLGALEDELGQHLAVG